MKKISMTLAVAAISLFLVCAKLYADESGGMYKNMHGEKCSSSESVGHIMMKGHKDFNGHDKNHFKRHGKKNGHKGYQMFKGGFLTSELQNLLGLDAEQMEKIKGLESRYIKTLIRSEADLKIAEIEMRELISAKEVNLDKVKEKTSLVGSLRSDLRFFRYKTMEDVKNILRDDQKEQFRKLSSRYMSGSRFYD